MTLIRCRASGGVFPHDNIEIPDELVKEILSDVLQVPDSLFISTDERSPFSFYKQSSMEYLLVCRSWRRVGTPYLYGTVVLRSKGQMQALERTLKEYPDLVRYIKKIRIEGGYCDSVYMILKAAKNLTDLSLSSQLLEMEDIEDLWEGLAVVQPRRVILYNGWVSWHKSSGRLEPRLRELVPRWQNLTEFLMLGGWGSDWYSGVSVMVDGLYQSQSLKFVLMPWEYSSQLLPEWFSKFASKPGMERILLYGFGTKQDCPSLDLFESILEKKPGLIQIVEKPTNPVPHSEGVIDQVLSVDRIPSAVWEIILEYAMMIPELEQPNFLKMPNVAYPCLTFDYRRSLITLSKKFYEIGRPLYYRCMVVTRTSQSGYLGRDPLESLACCVSSNLESNPRFHVRSLFLGSDPRSPKIGENLRKIFTSAPNLKRVHRIVSSFSAYYLKDPANWGISNDDQWLLPHGNPISWNAITLLADNCGSSIVDMDFCLNKDVNKSPEILCNFSALKHLVWDTVITLQLKNLSAIPRNSWSNLESITYVATRSKTFIDFLTYLDLPKLHTARFLGQARQLNDTNHFFENHGRKLQHLEIGFVEDDIHVFDLCPNLKTLDSPAQDAGPPYADFFTCSHEHPLEKIYIKSDERRAEYAQKNQYLLDLDLSNFKSLRSIQMSQCDEWPYKEHEIESSPWVTWAEQIKLKWNVNLLNCEGVAWRPRLKPYRNPSHQRAA